MIKKKWVVGATMIGMLSTGAAGVYAGSNLQEIKAYLNTSVGIVVNDKDFKPLDSKGKALAPITYNNTTYLPVRAISEALQVPVEFDAANNKVRIGGSGGSSASPGNTPPPSQTEPPATSGTSSKRPQHLPSDFPLPADFKTTHLNDTSSGGKKSVLMIYKTKEDAKKLNELYSDYLKKRSYADVLNASNESSISLMGESATESSMISSGSERDAEGYIEVTINWSEL